MLAAGKCNEIRRQVSHVLEEAGCSAGSPLSIREVIGALGIGLVPYSTLTEQEVQQLSQAFGGALPPGLLLHEPGHPGLIWYDDSLDSQQQDRAMAHELGHWKRQHCQASALAEEEAEFFSETLVKSIGRLTAEHFRRAGMKSMYDIHLDREVV